MAGHSGQLVGKMALSDYNPPHFQTRWLDIVGSWLEYEWRLVRLLEGPFVVLAQIRPLQSGYNIVMNVGHYIENSSGEYEHTDSCSSMSALHEENGLRAGGRQHQPHQYHHRTVARESV